MESPTPTPPVNSGINVRVSTPGIPSREGLINLLDSGNAVGFDFTVQGTLDTKITLDEFLRAVTGDFITRIYAEPADQIEVEIGIGMLGGRLSVKYLGDKPLTPRQEGKVSDEEAQA